MPIGLPAALAIGSIGGGVATGLLNRNQTQTVRTQLTPQQQQLSTTLSVSWLAANIELSKLAAKLVIAQSQQISCQSLIKSRLVQRRI